MKTTKLSVLRRKVLTCAIAWSGVAAIGVAGAAHAEANWPTKPVRIVVISSPGGLPDTAARVLAHNLESITGQSVVVENRTGASGNIATAIVARAEPDGHTLVVTGSTHATNQILLPDPGFDYKKDVVPVGVLAWADMLLVSGPKFPASNLKELVELAKTRTPPLSMAITQPGTPNHIAGERLKRIAGIDLNLVPYLGIAPAIPDLAAGRTDIALGSLSSVYQLVQAGTLKAIAVTSDQRSDFAPEVSTPAESGYPDFTITAWVSLMTTGGTPEPVLDKINAAMRQAMSTPHAKESLRKLGAHAAPGSRQELADLIQSEYDRSADILREVVKAKQAGG